MTKKFKKDRAFCQPLVVQEPCNVLCGLFGIELPSIDCRTEQRLQQLQKSLGEAQEDRRGVDGRLESAQTALALQEETIRRNERERKAMADRINALERQVVSAETERRQINVRLSKTSWISNHVKFGLFRVA